MACIRSAALVVLVACNPAGGDSGSADTGTDSPTTTAPPETTTETPPTTSTSTTDDPATSDGTTEDDPTDDPPTETDDPGTTTGLPSDVETIELRAGGYSPPTQETVYSCFSVTVEVDELHHIIGFRPAVTSPLIHHYVLSLADGAVETDQSSSCLEWPASILWAWAPGVEDTMLPPEAGILLGDAIGGQHTFIVQVHYNNPLGMALVDDDGIDVLVTPTLRENSAGIFSQGDIATIAIPPGNPAFEYTANCGSVFTEALLPEPIHVFSSFLHAHEIGAAMNTDLYRNDALVGNVSTQDPFDFNSQMFQPANIDIMPGDRIETVCTYDSTGRTGVTQGGPASDEEMCINFMMYYPKIPAETCGAL